MVYAQIALLILQEAPALIAVLQKWFAVGKTPTLEDLQAELAQLGISDASLNAAYARLFPGQTPPQ
jgi:hypothetical protein